jgi:hypothetical protein
VLDAAARERLRELAASATPGPWHFERFFREGDTPEGVARYRIFLLGHANPKTNSRDCDWTFSDAAFIAEARTAVPLLLASEARLRALCAELADIAMMVMHYNDPRNETRGARIAAIRAEIGCEE